MSHIYNTFVCRYFIYIENIDIKFSEKRVTQLTIMVNRIPKYIFTFIYFVLSCMPESIHKPKLYVYKKKIEIIQRIFIYIYIYTHTGIWEAEYGLSIYA